MNKYETCQQNKARQIYGRSRVPAIAQEIGVTNLDTTLFGSHYWQRNTYNNHDIGIDDVWRPLFEIAERTLCRRAISQWICTSRIAHLSDFAWEKDEINLWVGLKKFSLQVYVIKAWITISVSHSAIYWQVQTEADTFRSVGSLVTTRGSIGLI